MVNFFKKVANFFKKVVKFFKKLSSFSKYILVRLSGLCRTQTGQISQQTNTLNEVKLTTVFNEFFYGFAILIVTRSLRLYRKEILGRVNKHVLKLSFSPNIT